MAGQSGTVTTRAGADGRSGGRSSRSGAPEGDSENPDELSLERGTESAAGLEARQPMQRATHPGAVRKHPCPRVPVPASLLSPGQPTPC